MQFNNIALNVKENDNMAKFVNVYFVYDLDYWPRNPLNNFVLKSCLFVATNMLIKVSMYIVGQHLMGQVYVVSVMTLLGIL